MYKNLNGKYQDIFNQYYYLLIKKNKKSDTVEGEILRAIIKLYRNFINDKFQENSNTGAYYYILEKSRFINLYLPEKFNLILNEIEEKNKHSKLDIENILEKTMDNILLLIKNREGLVFRKNYEDMNDYIVEKNIQDSWEIVQPKIGFWYERKYLNNSFSYFSWKIKFFLKLVKFYFKDWNILFLQAIRFRIRNFYFSDF